jgi:hypothetical protein
VKRQTKFDGGFARRGRLLTVEETKKQTNRETQKVAAMLATATAMAPQRLLLVVIESTQAHT